MEYREGHYLYAREFPGNATFSDMTLSRGVTNTDTKFYAWIMRVVEGSTGEYRAKLEVGHYAREATQPGPQAVGQQPDLATLGSVTDPRKYIIYNAFPVRHKFAGDLDASASDVSIMELDVAYEHAEVVPAG